MGSRSRRYPSFLLPTAPPLLLATALLLAPAPLVAQDLPPTFEDSLEVREVLLDVLVTDEDGNVILGLDQSDFLVSEDGEAVPVESVSFYSNRRVLGLGAPSPDAPAQEDRYFVLVFYRPPVGLASNSRLFLQLPAVGKNAFRWAVEELLPNDHLAVLSYGSSLKLYHDFSRDRSRLGRAIQRAATGKAPDERWPSRTEAPLEGVTLRALVDREEIKEDTADVFDALAVLAQELATVRGRKNVILLGFDFPALGSSESRRGYEPMMETLNTGNVAVYTVGVSRQGFQPSLDQLAADTGGEYLYRFRSYLEPFRHIARQNSGYYLLSYRSSHPPGEQGYKQVEVRTTHEDLQVRARTWRSS